jgi:hypothetical protein
MKHDVAYFQLTPPSETDKALQEQLLADSLLLGPDFSSDQPLSAFTGQRAWRSSCTTLCCRSWIHVLCSEVYFWALMKPTPQPNSVGVRLAGPEVEYAFTHCARHADKRPCPGLPEIASKPLSGPQVMATQTENTLFDLPPRERVLVRGPPLSTPPPVIQHRAASMKDLKSYALAQGLVLEAAEDTKLEVQLGFQARLCPPGRLIACSFSAWPYISIWSHAQHLH